MRSQQHERVSAAINQTLVNNLNHKRTAVFFSQEDGEPTETLIIDSEVLAMLMGAEQVLAREILENAPLTPPHEGS